MSASMVEVAVCQRVKVLHRISAIIIIIIITILIIIIIIVIIVVVVEVVFISIKHLFNHLSPHSPYY